jgi:hypothetical protein
VEDPPPGTYRLKATSWAVSAARPVGIAAVVIRGDTTPDTTLSVSGNTSPELEADFTITTRVFNLGWVASGVQIC